MARTATRYLRLLGFVAWGDLANTTAYRSRRNKLVFYAKSPPMKPPSPRQTQCRAAINGAAQEWRLFTPTLKPNWEKATRRLSLPLNGYNLWVYWHITHDRQTIATIERQSQLQLLPAPTPPAPSESPPAPSAARGWRALFPWALAAPPAPPPPAPGGWRTIPIWPFSRRSKPEPPPT